MNSLSSRQAVPRLEMGALSLSKSKKRSHRRGRGGALSRWGRGSALTARANLAPSMSQSQIPNGNNRPGPSSERRKCAGRQPPLPRALRGPYREPQTQAMEGLGPVDRGRPSCKCAETVCVITKRNEEEETRLTVRVCAHPRSPVLWCTAHDGSHESSGHFCGTPDVAESQSSSAGVQTGMLGSMLPDRIHSGRRRLRILRGAIGQATWLAYAPGYHGHHRRAGRTPDSR